MNDEEEIKAPPSTTKSGNQGRGHGYPHDRSKGRIRQLLIVQEYLCPCGTYINGGKCYDFGEYLTCGTCAIRARTGQSD